MVLLNLHVAAASVHPSLPFGGGKDNWLKVHPGSTTCISCRGRATLSIYKSPLAHIGICCSRVLSWLPSGFSEKLAKTQKVSKE